MVLPEIEEEDEDLNQRHSKLSLTSLLLGRLPEGSNGISAHTPTPDVYEGSGSTPLPQGTRAFHGVSWRNGTQSPSQQSAGSNSHTPQPPYYNQAAASTQPPYYNQA